MLSLVTRAPYCEDDSHACTQPNANLYLRQLNLINEKYHTYSSNLKGTGIKFLNYNMKNCVLTQHLNSIQIDKIIKKLFYFCKQLNEMYPNSPSFHRKSTGIYIDV